MGMATFRRSREAEAEAKKKAKVEKPEVKKTVKKEK